MQTKTKATQKKKSKYEPVGYKLRVGRSRTGLGLFAGEDIKRGTCVIEYTGREVVGKEQYTSRSKYLFEVSKDRMIDGAVRTNTARYINHSCAPNCEIEIKKGHVLVMAKKNIKAGEELNYDYDTEYFEEYIKPKGCLCLSCSPLTAKEKAAMKK
jgi:SET domain-containing protein